jgi:hypothetical protein
MAYIGRTPTGSILTGADIADGSISTAKLADTAVSTAKIADDAVTNAKTAFDDVPFRNIIINGDMSVAQRGTSFTGQTSGAYYLDRFKTDISGLGTWTIEQVTDVPTGQGFQKSMRFRCTTADASPSAGDFLYLNQPIEGFNTASFKFGTANAESLTLSFWVKGDKTGTHIVRFYDIDNGRSLSKAYTINSALTWEKKTITISGDTVSSPNFDNGYAFAINWCLGAGSNYTSGTLNESWNSNVNANAFVGQVNVADSTSNAWYITGVQLEVGTTASDFEFLPYDVNLNRCLRYYEKSYDNSTTPATNTETGTVSLNGLSTSSKQIRSHDTRYYPKRTAPTVTIYDVAGNSGRWSTYNSAGSKTDNVSGIAVITKGIQSFQVYQNGTVAAGYQYHFTSDAEL